MKKPLVIPRYAAYELERAALWARKSRQCSVAFEKWLEKTISREYDFFDLMRILSSTDREDVDVKELEKTINNWIETQDKWAQIQSASF